MSKPCIKCGKKLGFNWNEDRFFPQRDSKSSRKEIDATCTAYRNTENQTADITCSNQLASAMDSKDRVCSACAQAHILEHHLIAFIDDQRETHTGFLGKRKFKKLMEDVPFCFSEITPTWDPDVTGNETFGQLYDKMTEKIQNTERKCPWCKKYFKRLQMVKMGLKIIYDPTVGILECSNCAEIRSRLTSERLRSLMDEYWELKSRDGSDSQELRNARSALNNARSAKNVSTARNIVGHFMSGYNTDLSRSDLTSYASNEADARYEALSAEEQALSAEAQEIAEYESERKQDLPREIETEQLVLAHQHFGAPSLLLKKKPRRKAPKKKAPKKKASSERDWKWKTPDQKAEEAKKKAQKRKAPPSSGGEDPIKALKLRFAKGEITKEEFLEMKSMLE